MINNLIIHKSFKDFTNHRKNTNRAVFFSCRLFPNILVYRDHQWNLSTIWKKESLRHLLKSSVTMYESSDSQFFRTTTGMQSQPYTFDESRFIMTFLTILGAMEICNFRLVLEGKTSKGIPESSRLELLGKPLANNFVLSDAKDNISELLNRGGYSRFSFVENTISNLPKTLRVRFLGSNRLWRPAALLKGDSRVDVFLCNLLNF